MTPRFRRIGGTLTWYCDECGEPIADNRGYLRVSKAFAVMQKQRREGVPVDSKYTEGWSNRRPRRIPWRALCSGCGDDCVGDYTIDADQSDVLHRAELFLERPDVRETNWASYLQLVGEYLTRTDNRKRIR